MVLAHATILLYFIILNNLHCAETSNDVRWDLVPLPKLPHILYSHLVSSLDNLMMAYIQDQNM